MRYQDQVKEDKNETHYTAYLKVQRVEVKHFGSPTQKRDISEVAHLTVRAKTLGGLMDRIRKHTSIIETEEEEIR